MQRHPLSKDRSGIPTSDAHWLGCFRFAQFRLPVTSSHSVFTDIHTDTTSPRHRKRRNVGPFRCITGTMLYTCTDFVLHTRIARGTTSYHFSYTFARVCGHMCISVCVWLTDTTGKPAGTMSENAGTEGKDSGTGKQRKLGKYHRDLEVNVGHTLQYRVRLFKGKCYVVK